MSSHKAFSQDKEAPKRLALAEAVMCEKIENFVPINAAIVFPTALERISCYTSFDPVPQNTFVFHNWFFKDKLSTRIKLSLQPPRWSTFSSIQLREADKGPWRVEITDKDGRVFHVLRFSITD
jgi:hypothetical protein